MSEQVHVPKRKIEGSPAPTPMPALADRVESVPLGVQPVAQRQSAFRTSIGASAHAKRLPSIPSIEDRRAAFRTSHKFGGEMVEPEPQVESPIQRLEIPAEPTPTPPLRNDTGLPDRLKASVEGLSGFPMDDVKVHYGSSKPAQLQALAYTQGTDIHIGPGQARHLPHEAWHVVQQKQGRVSATVKMKGVEINDDTSLEREADLFGQRSLHLATATDARSPSPHGGPAARRRVRGAASTGHVPGGLVQRVIEGESNSYSCNATRPGFLQVAEELLMGQLNEQEGTNYQVGEKKFQTHKLDRAHVVAFAEMQGWIVDYLNDGGAEVSLRQNIGALIGNSDPAFQDRVNEALNDLTATNPSSDDTQTVVDFANTLLSLVNSVPENLRPGSKYINAYAQDNLDPRLQYTPGGKHLQFDDHTRNMAALGTDTVGNFLLTPQKSRLVSSNGPVDLNLLTPKSMGLVGGSVPDVRNIRSQKLKNALTTTSTHGRSLLQSGAGSSATSSQSSSSSSSTILNTLKASSSVSNSTSFTNNNNNNNYVNSNINSGQAAYSSASPNSYAGNSASANQYTNQQQLAFAVQSGNINQTIPQTSGSNNSQGSSSSSNMMTDLSNSNTNLSLQSQYYAMPSVQQQQYLYFQQMQAHQYLQQRRDNLIAELQTISTYPPSPQVLNQYYWLMNELASVNFQLGGS